MRARLICCLDCSEGLSGGSNACPDLSSHPFVCSQAQSSTSIARKTCFRRAKDRLFNGFAGDEGHSHATSVLKARKVCRPVTSTPNAKLPLPTCRGVLWFVWFRTGLKRSTTASRSAVRAPAARNEFSSRPSCIWTIIDAAPVMMDVTVPSRFAVVVM